jgi:senataxin
MQLPATVFYPKAKNILYNRSLFERLIDNNIPRHILTIQYRMQTNIRQFISSLFYDNKLKDADKNYTDKINNNIFYKIIDINKNFSFFDLNFSDENINEKMKSYYNIQEIGFTFDLIKKIDYCLKNLLNSKNNNENKYEYKYAIITPYQAQVKKFKEEKNNIKELSGVDIAINTVDSFQGQERDIVLFSTVRSNNNNKKALLTTNNTNKGESETIGFLNDFRRMNVALSRAKLGCFIVGNSEKFKSDFYWAKLIQFCKDKNSFYTINSKNEFNIGMKNIFI